MKNAYPHGLEDSSGEGVIRSESSSRVVFLSAGRADILVRTEAAGGRHVLVTADDARITEPYQQLMRETGGQWVARDAEGYLRDGLSGHRLDRHQHAGSTVVPPRSVHPGHLLRHPTSPRIRLVVARRHRPAMETLLGHDAQLISEWAGGVEPGGWGLHEPAGLDWDRQAITDYARVMAPEPVRVVVTGTASTPSALTLTVHRTKRGLEEITEGLVPGTVLEQPTDAATHGITSLLTGIANQGVPLIALAFADRGNADLTRSPVAASPAVPLALLIGPVGVRDLGIDPKRMVERHGAVIVGRKRIASVIVPFVASGGPSGVPALIDDLGREKVARVLGRRENRLLGLDDGHG